MTAGVFFHLPVGDKRFFYQIEKSGPSFHHDGIFIQFVLLPVIIDNDGYAFQVERLMVLDPADDGNLRSGCRIPEQVGYFKGLRFIGFPPVGSGQDQRDSPFAG